MKMKLIKEGAEAKVYETKLFGTTVIVKNRQKKRYREKRLDEMLRSSRTKREARLFIKARDLGINVPNVIGVGRYTIVMSKVEGLLLKDVGASKHIFNEIGKALAKLHNADIVHGDFTPANVMYNGSGNGSISIIDFGLGEVTQSIEQKALDLLLMKRSVSRSKYATLLSSYEKNCRDAKKIVSRLKEIEMRGRYQNRSLDAKEE